MIMMKAFKFDHAGQILWDMSGHPYAAGQLPEAPSALRLVPHPASPLGDALLAGTNLQVGFGSICLILEPFSFSGAALSEGCPEKQVILC